MFLSNYTHTDFSHLAGNLIFYFIIIFLLLNVETNKKLFYKASLLIFILLPILASLLIVYSLPSLPPVQGFSAIDAAFVGYFLFSVYIHLKKYYTSSLGFSFFALLLMINFEIVIFTYSQFSAFILILLFLILLFWINMSAIKEIAIKLIMKYKHQKRFIGLYNIIVFLMVIFFVFYLSNIIPPEIRNGNTLINTPAHYFGYAFGVFVPIIIEKLKS